MFLPIPTLYILATCQMITIVEIIEIYSVVPLNRICNFGNISNHEHVIQVKKAVFIKVIHPYNID